MSYSSSALSFAKLLIRTEFPIDKTKFGVRFSGSESWELRMNSGKSVESGRSWERLDGVDLLRGLAIFLVLMNHVNLRLVSADVL
jgi:hypothetical protein